MKKVGLVLRAARESAGISQSALARRIGISAGQLAQIENGQRADPYFSSVARIAGALGLSLDSVAALCGTPGFSKTPRVRSSRAAIRIRIGEELDKAQRDISNAAKHLSSLREAVNEHDEEQG